MTDRGLCKAEQILISVTLTAQHHSICTSLCDVIHLTADTHWRQAHKCKEEKVLQIKTFLLGLAVPIPSTLSHPYVSMPQLSLPWKRNTRVVYIKKTNNPGHGPGESPLPLLGSLEPALYLQEEETLQDIELHQTAPYWVLWQEQKKQTRTKANWKRKSAQSHRTVSHFLLRLPLLRSFNV